MDDINQGLFYIQGLRSFKDTLPKNIKKILNKRGYIYSDIINNWNYLVGKNISSICYPKSFKASGKNNEATLTISVQRGNEIDVEYSKAEIIKKINVYFGYKILSKIKFGQNILTVGVFLSMTILPFIESITRLFNLNSIPASQILVQHFTLWIGFLGAVIAASKNNLLALTRESLFIIEEKIHIGRWLAKVTTFLVLISLAWGSWELVMIEMNTENYIAPFVPRWFAQIIMPVGFFLMAVQIFFNSYIHYLHRFSFIIIGVLFLYTGLPEILYDALPVVPFGIIIVIISLYYGAPIFVGLGGIAVLMFWASYTPIAAIPVEAYRIVVSPTLPTIPLFTLAGYVLAESKASERLVKVFSELFGWIPGGTPVIIVILCGFFTALTGGSGVTILALGGLLLPMLLKDGYSKPFSLGLITVSGSIGLLFPPSLPLIIYGITAGVSVKDVFIAGLIPGFLLITMISSYAIFYGKRNKIKLNPFIAKNVIQVCWDTKWELLLPVIILLGVGKIIKAPFFFVAVGSQANVGGAASAPIVASAFHPSLAPVGVLLAVFGYALGTYAAWFCAILMQSAVG